MTYALAQSLQKAIYETLIADPAVQALIGTHIYDSPLPLENATDLPDYVTFGREAVKEAGSATSDGALHDFQIIVHSAESGFSPAKTIAGAICDALLDAQLTLSRGDLIYLRFLRAKAATARTERRKTISLDFRAFVEDGNG